MRLPRTRTRNLQRRCKVWAQPKEYGRLLAEPCGARYNRNCVTSGLNRRKWAYSAGHVLDTKWWRQSSKLEHPEVSGGLFRYSTNLGCRQRPLLGFMFINHPRALCIASPAGFKESRKQHSCLSPRNSSASYSSPSTGQWTPTWGTRI